MKIPILFILISTLVMPALSDVVDTSVRTCNSELLQNYGLHGLEKAEEIPLKMCPDVQYSCCQESDQMEIFFNWLGDKKKTFISDYYKQLSNVYFSLFDELTEVHNFADKISRILKDKSVSNCKFQAELLKKFSIKELGVQMNINMQKMESFFVESYQGFYCSICNQDNHQYINKEKKKITYSVNFCRDIVEQTISPLVFLYDDVVRYLNFVTRFLQTCNYAGKYKPIDDIPENLRLKEENIIGNSIKECVVNRNKKSWYFHCIPVCKNFSIARFNQYFEPRRKDIENYVKYISKTLQDNQSMEGAEKKASSARILAAAAATTAGAPGAPAVPGVVKATGSIVYGVNDPKKINLDDFEADFAGEGLYPLAEGRNSLINYDVYIQVKTKLEIETSNEHGVSRTLKLVQAGKSMFRKLFGF